MSLAIRKMQIKTTLRFHVTPVRMAKIENTSQLMLVRIWSKVNTPQLQVGVQTCPATLEINMVISQKTGTQSTSSSKGHSILPQGHLLSYVHSSFICSSQNLETT